MTCGYLFILSPCDSTLHATTLQQLNPRCYTCAVDRRPSALVPVTIKFTAANLTNTNLSGSELKAVSSYAGATIDFTHVDLAHADLSGSEITAEGYDASLIDFAQANLAHADPWGQHVRVSSEAQHRSGALVKTLYRTRRVTS